MKISSVEGIWATEVDEGAMGGVRSVDLLGERGVSLDFD